MNYICERAFDCSVSYPCNHKGPHPRKKWCDGSGGGVYNCMYILLKKYNLGLDSFLDLIDLITINDLKESEVTCIPLITIEEII